MNEHASNRTVTFIYLCIALICGLMWWGVWRWLG